MKVVGLMSGTSLDGIDAALVEIEGPGPGGRAPAREGSGARDPAEAPAPGSVRWRVLGWETFPYDEARRRAIQDAVLRGTPASLARLHVDLGEWLADATLAVCRAGDVAPEDVTAVGSHGQTVWHDPPTAESPRGATLQIGDAATIAERTGIDVVSDFRARDVAAGGHGAPLVPWVDRLLFTTDTPRVLVNIGGMANLTWLPPKGSEDPVIAFDTGPGNAVIDAAMERATNGGRRYDANGEWARRGRVEEALVETLLADPWFQRPPPRSTGRERFGAPFVERLVADRDPSDGAEWAALVASLTALVARSIAGAVERWAPAGGDGEVVVTGGGAANPVLMDWLQAELDPVPVRPGDALGIDPAAKEAVAFAVLAWAHVTGRAANLPSATGAAGPRLLGSLTPGNRAGRAMTGGVDGTQSATTDDAGGPG